MISDTRLEMLNHFEEVLKDSKRLEWLIEFVDRTGFLTKADIKRDGIDCKNHREFIDLMMNFPIDEVFAGWNKE